MRAALIQMKASPERKENHDRVIPGEGELYGAAVLVDGRGAIAGHYRKHHIPMSSPFHQKFYFRPGNLGYPVFDTPHRQILRSIQLLGERVLPALR